jgi:hypothetical protein
MAQGTGNGKLPARMVGDEVLKTAQELRNEDSIIVGWVESTAKPNALGVLKPAKPNALGLLKPAKPNALGLLKPAKPNALGLLGYFEAKGYANEAQPNLQICILLNRH